MPHHIYRRKGSKSYWYSVKVKGRARIRQSAGTSDAKKAKALAQAIEDREWQRRIQGDPAALTFAEAVMDYVADGKSRRFLAPLVNHFRDTRVTEIRPGHIKAAARIIYPGAQPATWNRQVIVPVRAVINHAAAKDLAAFIKIDTFPVLRTPRRAPAADWLPKFIAAATDPRQGALALFLRITGVRLGQAIALTWRDLDLAAGKVHIAAAQKGRGFPAREAELTPQMVAMLANLPGDRVGRVFGVKHRGKAFYKAWKATCTRAGIPYVTTHPAGRRGFFTTMHRAGVDPKTAARRGGLASVKLALEIYTDEDQAQGLITDVFGTIGAQSEAIVTDKINRNN